MWFKNLSNDIEKYIDFIEPEYVTKFEYKGVPVYLIHYYQGVGLTDFYNRYTKVLILIDKDRDNYISYDVNNDTTLDMNMIINIIDRI